jgi:hypothetical protein
MGVIHSTSTTTIVSGQTTSPAFWCGAKVPVSLQMPAAFTGASVSFLGSNDNDTYQAIYVANALYSENVTAAKNIALDSNILAGFKYLKIVSASTETRTGGTTIVILRRRPSGG